MTARRAARELVLGALLLGGSCFLALRPLAHFWSANENYAYGLGVPFLAAYLLCARWRVRPAPARGDASARRLGWLALVVVVWALVFLAGRLVVETEPASRPVLWFDASLLASALLAWFGMLGGRPWLRHFAFPILFLLVSVPWFFQFEQLLTQSLMKLNAAWVADTLALLDLPARAAGSTIYLATGQLGVTEACSGIRSLQAALMMGLFFGEFYRFTGRGRAALLLTGAGLALIGNFGRMLFLAWRGAHAGIASVEAAHDSAGLLILGFSVISLWLVCLATRTPNGPASPASPDSGALCSPLGFPWAVGVFIATLFAEVATQGWYGWREASALTQPTWSISWPAASPDFHLITLPAAVHAALHDDASTAAAWSDPSGWEWNGVWIRYHASATGKIIFESHNPALCLPAAGWQALPGTAAFRLNLGAVLLEVRGYAFVSRARAAYVFWIPYLDRGHPAQADRLAGAYGHTLAALFQGNLPWLADVWHGCRGADAETLEIEIIGPRDYLEADAAFRAAIPRLVIPDAPTAMTAGNR